MNPGARRPLPAGFDDCARFGSHNGIPALQDSQRAELRELGYQRFSQPAAARQLQTASLDDLGPGGIETPPVSREARPGIVISQSRFERSLRSLTGLKHRANVLPQAVFLFIDPLQSPADRPVEQRGSPLYAALMQPAPRHGQTISGGLRELAPRSFDTVQKLLAGAHNQLGRG